VIEDERSERQIEQKGFKKELEGQMDKVQELKDKLLNVTYLLDTQSQKVAQSEAKIHQIQQKDVS
jgi:hypothetical protein